MHQPGTEAVQRAYDALAPGYDRRWRRYVDATLRAAVGGGALDGEGPLLDLACGTGELGRLLEGRGRRPVVGADLSLGMLRRASAKGLGADFAWVQADSARLPFADARFGAVACANSFHYFRSPAAAIAEVRRVLRPGGRLVLVDWCDDYLACRACGLWLRWTDPAFRRAYRLSECRDLLAGSGFRVEEAVRFKVDWLWGLMRLVGRRP